MAEHKSTPLEELSSCPVCLEIYKDPRILSCLHVLCDNCVQHLTKVNEVECPECRKLTNVENIRNDFNKQSVVDCYIQERQNLDEFANMNSLCNGCNSDLIEWRCTECNMNICRSCKDAHNTFPVTKSHELLYIDKSTLEIKASISRILPEIDNLKNDVESQMKHYVNLKDELKSSVNDATEEINCRRKTLHELVDTNHDDKLQKLSKGTSEIHKTLIRTCEEMSSMIETCEVKRTLLNSIAKTDYLSSEVECESNKLGEVQTEISQIQARLEEISQVQFPQFPHVDGCDLKAYSFTDLAIDANNITNQTNSLNRNDKCNSADCSRENQGELAQIPVVEDQNNLEFVKIGQHGIGHTSLRLKLYKKQLWSLGKDGAVYIYDRNCKYIQSIKDASKMTHPVDFTVDHADNIIFACSRDEGLKHFDPEFDYVSTFSAGTFYSVTSDGKLLFALKHDRSRISKMTSKWLKSQPHISSKVAIFHYRNFHNSSKSSPWVEKQHFIVQHKDICSLDSLCVRKSLLYVSSNTESVIYKYDFEGVCLAKYGQPGILAPGHLWGTRMCGTDAGDSILVADTENHRLQCLSEQGGWNVLHLKEGTPKPVAVAMDDTGKFAWVVCNPYNESNQLWTFTLK